MRRSVVLPFLLGGLVAVAGISTLTWATDGWRAFTAEEARRLAVKEHPRPVPADVELRKATGESITLADLRDRHLLVDFIYTGCAHACTTLGATFRAIQESLPTQRLGEDVVLLSITFDRPRDDLERLQMYGDRFDANPEAWLLTRPRSDADLQTLLERFGVVVLPDDGEFVHNAAIYHVDTEGQLDRVFEFDDPDAVVQSMESTL